MNGTLIKINDVWFVQYKKDNHLINYPLCEKSTIWILKPEVKKFIKEGVEVVFHQIVKGEHCETKEMLQKNYFAKVVQIQHETL